MKPYIPQQKINSSKRNSDYRCYYNEENRENVSRTTSFRYRVCLNVEIFINDL